MVTDEAHGAAEHEETIEAAESHEIVGLFPGEGPAGANHVCEADSDAAIHVQDQIGSLPRCDLLNCQGEIQNAVVVEELLRVLLDDDDSLVGVRQRLDAVANSHDEFILLLALVHKILGRNSTVAGVCEHFRRIVQGAAKSWADCQQAAAKSGHQILASSRCHDGVVCAADGRSMICGHHQDHLDKLAACSRQLPSEPEQRQNTANAHTAREHI
mmetsp:Transcript_58068/g.136081  ORF Transcript_58068/g.136081 Transcript_58068/m.136081 type:complete len:214 (+) Transcript_58068:157-798(+)